VILAVFLLYVPGVNEAFGARPVRVEMFMCSGIGFAIYLLGWAETRKLIVRVAREMHMKGPNKLKTTWWEDHTIW
jgi:hypothetical protein